MIISCMKDLYRIHVVCLGNIARSPAAEYMLQHYMDLEQKNRNSSISVEVSSSGTNGGMYTEMEPLSEEYLRENGIVPKGFQSRRATRGILENQDIILLMERYMIQNLWDLAPNKKYITFKEAAGESGNVRDPYGDSKPEYYQVMKLIDDCSKKIAQRFYDGKLIDLEG